MFDWFPYRLTFARTDMPARSRRQVRPRIGKRLALVVGGLATLGATGILSLPAAAGTAGSVTATIPIAILSLTVRPGVVTFGNCRDGTGTAIPGGLAFPNGGCRTTTGITITNTGLPGRIQGQGSDAVPQDGGTPHWALCLPGDSVHAGTCSGPAPIPGSLIRLPGLDQFRESLDGPRLSGLDLLSTPICDLAFLGQGPACASAAPGAAVTEFLNMFGPTRSTNPATSFTTTVTWTVVL